MIGENQLTPDTYCVQMMDVHWKTVAPQQLFPRNAPKYNLRSHITFQTHMQLKTVAILSTINAEEYIEILEQHNLLFRKTKYCIHNTNMALQKSAGAAFNPDPSV